MTDIANREGLLEYDVTWPWRAPLEKGVTAVLRVRNEAHNLPWVLPPLFRAVQRVLLVDNRSDDDTAGVARRVAHEVGAADRLAVRSYPFDVARCGREHLYTPGDSVHSLTHYYNWSFAQVGTTMSTKWDGDIVLTEEGVATLADAVWQMEGRDYIGLVPLYPLTVESERVGYLDLGKPHTEPWIFPNAPGTHFLKAFEWELRDFPEEFEKITLPRGLCVELKWLEHDEFSHWTSTEEFESGRAQRKQREWTVNRAIVEGSSESIPELVRIEAPEGVHIIDHVTRTWMPQADLWSS